MASLSCRRLRTRLVDLAEGTLDIRDRRRVEGHLAGCETCAAELETLRAARIHIPAAAPEPDGEALGRQREAILRRIREPSASHRLPVRVAPRRPAAPFPRGVFIAAATAIAIASIGWWRFEATFRPAIQAAGRAAPVPNDVDALDGATLAALADVAAAIAAPRLDDDLEMLETWRAENASLEDRR